jgi:hypothetical protein
MMPGSIADILQIIMLASGTNATLAGNGSGIFPVLFPYKDPFKLEHTRIGKEQSRVIMGDKG